MNGVSHTDEVMAATPYEAVARGLAALRGNEWVSGVPQGPSVVKVSVADVRVEHEVKFADFMKWLDRPPRSPRNVSARHEIRCDPRNASFTIGADNCGPKSKTSRDVG
jgi:hypothetical protein